MSIDQKTAKHICNVIRRQVQNSYPDLYINFTIHKKNERHKAYFNEETTITEHRAGGYLNAYIKSEQAGDILKGNNSCFAAIAFHNNPGFIGFFKSKLFMASCFINYENYDDEDKLRNYALHLAWHVLSLYKDFLQENKGKFTFKDNIITPAIESNDIYRLNLSADIFAASVQFLQGKENAINTLFTQRVEDALNAKTEFIAKDFLFPVCVDTLEFILENNIEQYKKNKKTIIAASAITKDIEQTYEDISIEQWHSFIIPAQEMAFIGYDANTILSCALYTGENTYMQLIADMIAERMNIKTRIITIQKEYNPFANKESNLRLHKRQCSDIINMILDKTHDKGGYIYFMEEAQKQNTSLLKGIPTGWCAYALLKTAEFIKQTPESDNKSDNKGNEKDQGKKSHFSTIKDSARKIFDKEQALTDLDIIIKFTRTLLKYRINGHNINMDIISEIAKNNNEFEYIYEALSMTNSNQSVTNEVMDNESTKDRATENKKSSLQKNITDFISPNAIKQ